VTPIPAAAMSRMAAAVGYQPITTAGAGGRATVHGTKGLLLKQRRRLQVPRFRISSGSRTEVRSTLRWREMDLNFQYASTVRWHRAADWARHPTVKRRSGAPASHAISRDNPL